LIFMPAPSISELLSQIPDTDREISSRTPLPTDAAAAEKEKKRRAAEERWGKASKFTGPYPVLAEELARGVFDGGRKSIRELLSLVRDPADIYYKGYKPEYLLHNLTLYAGGRTKEKERKLFIGALDSALADKDTSRYLQVVLIRELGWIGHQDAIKTLGRFLTDNSLCDEAAAALTTIGSPAATEQFRHAFAKSHGKCRLTIAQHLGTFRDAASVADLLEALIEPNDELRLTAAWSLARIGDPRAINPILKFATEATGYTRTKVTQYALLLAETLAATGRPNDAMKIYTYLKEIRTAPEDRYLQELLNKRISTTA
jgi:hypothetical protein